jgi:ParB-like chromosome segregation protein Spo0J
MTQDDLPELTPEQYEQLREDIRLRGVQAPVEICAISNSILDGRARVRACSELKIATYPRRIVGGLDSEEARRHHRLKANCLRRQLDRTALKALMLAEMRRKAQSDRLLAGIFGVSHTAIANWRREFIASGKLLPQEVFEGKGRKYRRPAAIYAQTPVAADRAAKLLNELGEDAPPGKHLSARAAGELLLGKRKERADRQEISPPQGVKLFQGRFQDVGKKVGSASLDVIWTDPPWNREWLPQWTDLGGFAERTLRTGGLLVTYAPVAYLGPVLAALEMSGLSYIWSFCIANGQQTSPSWGSGAVSCWHPLVVFGKETNRLPGTVRDFFQGGGAEKSSHAWQEGEAETEYFLSHLTKAGSVVCDPCCGSSTTLAVARRL